MSDTLKEKNEAKWKKIYQNYKNNKINYDYDDFLKKILKPYSNNLENNFKSIKKAIKNITVEILGLEKFYDMYVEIYFKNGKEKKVLFIEDVKWSEIVETLEEWINDPKKCDFVDEIKYISVKANDIKYYQVNTIIKNLTKKATLIKMKEKPI